MKTTSKTRYKRENIDYSEATTKATLSHLRYVPANSDCQPNMMGEWLVLQSHGKNNYFTPRNSSLSIHLICYTTTCRIQPSGGRDPFTVINLSDWPDASTKDGLKFKVKEKPSFTDI